MNFIIARISWVILLLSFLYSILGLTETLVEIATYMDLFLLIQGIGTGAVLVLLYIKMKSPAEISTVFVIALFMGSAGLDWLLLHYSPHFFGYFIFPLLSLHWLVFVIALLFFWFTLIKAKPA